MEALQIFCQQYLADNKRGGVRRESGGRQCQGDMKIRKLGFFGPLKTFNNPMSDDDGSQRTKSVFTPDRGVGTCQM